MIEFRLKTLFITERAYITGNPKHLISIKDMSNISPARIMGRIDYATVQILRRNGLSTSEDNVDTPAILYALSQRLAEPQGEACMHLAVAYVEARNRLGAMGMPVNEADLEMARGRQDAGFLYRTYGSGAIDHLMADHDFSVDIAAETQRKKKETLRNIFLGVGIVALIAIIISVYNLPYFAEGRLYDKYQEAIADDSFLVESLYNEYMQKYPDGRHAQEVAYFFIIREAGNSPGLGDALDACMEYLKNFPDGKYSAKITRVYDSIWDSEISKYERDVAPEVSPEASAYVRSMLAYMKAHNLHAIAVRSNAALHLKEYSEYPSNVRTLMESVSNDASKPLEPKLPDDMVTIKDQVTEESAAGWTSQIIDGLQSGFNSVFTPSFIKFVSVDELEGQNVDEMPAVTVDYVVSTQETKFGGYVLPDVWSSTGVVPGGGKMVLGIAMDFKAVFTLPGAQPFEVTAKGDAGKEQIQSESGNYYDVMCRRCVDTFSDKIESSFGIDGSKRDSDEAEATEIAIAVD